MRNKVIALELSEGINPITATGDFEGVYVLVCYRGLPIGFVILKKEMTAGTISVNQLRESITRHIGWALVTAVLASTFGPAVIDNGPLPPVSIIVCTRDRANQLAHCLQTLLSIDYPDYEIIVVDNAPSNDATSKLATKLAVRYIKEDRPGLDWARNCGIAEAKHDIIVFIDDDARPDRKWLRAISTAFADPGVMAVTGLIVPLELETRAQNLFEFSYGGMGKGFRRRLVNRGALTTRDLIWANAFGAGTNMAFRRDVFASVGLFDVALDAGTPSGGGGDVEMFHRVVVAGHTLIYEPAAWVWHLHRRNLGALRRQLFDNGRSFGSYLLTCARNRTISRYSIIHFVVREWLYGWILRRLLRPRGFPRDLIISECFGMLISPIAYLASQVHARRISTGEWCLIL